MSKEKGVNLTRFQRKDFKTCVGDAPANVKIMQPDGIGFARFLTFTIGRARVLRQYFADKQR